MIINNKRFDLVTSESFTKSLRKIAKSPELTKLALENPILALAKTKYVYKGDIELVMVKNDAQTFHFVIDPIMSADLSDELIKSIYAAKSYCVGSGSTLSTVATISTEFILTIATLSSVATAGTVGCSDPHINS